MFNILKIKINSLNQLCYVDIFNPLKNPFSTDNLPVFPKWIEIKCQARLQHFEYCLYLQAAAILAVQFPIEAVLPCHLTLFYSLFLVLLLLGGAIFGPPY